MRAWAAWGDAGLLRRLMANLIDALEFTARTPDARIHIGRQPDGPAGGPPVFFVQDNGAGFDNEVRGGCSCRSSACMATMISPAPAWALATVQRIVARHGGRIWAEAAVSQGVTFRFIINPSRAG